MRISASLVVAAEQARSVCGGVQQASRVREGEVERVKDMKVNNDGMG